MSGHSCKSKSLKGYDLGFDTFDATIDITFRSMIKNCNLKLILVTIFSAPNKLNLYSGAFTSTF